MTLKQAFKLGGETYAEYLNRYHAIYADDRNDSTNTRTKYFIVNGKLVFVTQHNGNVTAYGDVSNPDIEMEYLKRKGLIS